MATILLQPRVSEGAAMFLSDTDIQTADWSKKEHQI